MKSIKSTRHDVRRAKKNLWASSTDNCLWQFYDSMTHALPLYDSSWFALIQGSQQCIATRTASCFFLSSAPCGMWFETALYKIIATTSPSSFSSLAEFLPRRPTSAHHLVMRMTQVRKCLIAVPGFKKLMASLHETCEKTMNQTKTPSDLMILVGFNILIISSVKFRWNLWIHYVPKYALGISWKLMERIKQRCHAFCTSDEFRDQPIDFWSAVSSSVDPFLLPSQFGSQIKMVNGLLNLLPFQFPLTLLWVFHIHSCVFLHVSFLGSHLILLMGVSIRSLYRIDRCRGRGTLGTLRGGPSQRRWWPQDLGFQGDLGMVRWWNFWEETRWMSYWLALWLCWLWYMWICFIH